MGTRARGTGSVFKPKGSSFWWVAYMSGGKRHYESTKSTRKQDAQTLLTSRLGDVQRGVPVTPRVAKLMFAEAAQDVINDFKATAKRSIKVVERRIRKHLEPYFRDRRMATITTADVTAFVVKRQTENTVLVRKEHTVKLPDGTEHVVPEERRPASNAEINRELQVLKRAFRLAIQSGKLLHRPHIAMLRESNARAGFFEPEQLSAVLAQLPEPVRPVIRFAAITGWRIPSEVLPLEWRHVDLKAGEVHLDPGTTKNRDGRVFPMTSALRALLEAQQALHDALKEEGRIVPWVFHRDGEPIISFYTSWRRACRDAGCPGRIPHDLRRTAVRALVRAGISERVAMKMTGHKTRSVFERYNIVSDGDLLEAARKLDGVAAVVPEVRQA